MIGNAGILESLGNLTAGVYNYIRAANSKAYKLKDIIPKAYDYIYPPQDNTTSPSETLLSYMIQAKGFNKERFRVDK